MLKTKLVVAAVFVAAVALPAEARRSGRGSDDFCTSADRAAWRPISSVAAKARAMGYSVWKAEVSGTCYEVYGRKRGISYELYFNPATGSLVRIERD
jgi:hypothetical protein